MNEARVQETRELAMRDYQPLVQRAPGFVSFTLVRDEGGINIAIVLFESKAHADAFEGEGERWRRKLAEMGHQIDTRESGEVTMHITPDSILT